MGTSGILPILELEWTFTPEFWGTAGTFLHLRVEVSSTEYPYRVYFEDYSTDLSGGTLLSPNYLYWATGRDIKNLTERYAREVPEQERQEEEWQEVELRSKHYGTRHAKRFGAWE